MLHRRVHSSQLPMAEGYATYLRGWEGSATVAVAIHSNSGPYVMAKGCKCQTTLQFLLMFGFGMVPLHWLCGEYLESSCYPANELFRRFGWYLRL